MRNRLFCRSLRRLSIFSINLSSASLARPFATEVFASAPLVTVCSPSRGVQEGFFRQAPLYKGGVNKADGGFSFDYTPARRVSSIALAQEDVSRR